MNVKSPNNISIWQMGFNSAFKGLMEIRPAGAALIHMDRQTGGHDESNIRFSRLCDRA
jgi:hypothetical protein